jgi:hypothetical protein
MGAVTQRIVNAIVSLFNKVVPSDLTTTHFRMRKLIPQRAM